MTLVKKIICSIAVIIFSITAYSQEIVNIVYVNDQGITENLQTALSFIAIKQYPGGIFERLDYEMGAPLTMLRTYNDSNLTNLNGKYLKYHESGTLQISGQYNDNQKIGDWFYYNDSGKVITTEIYSDNVLISSVNPDTVKQDTNNYKDDRESAFAKGKSAWLNYWQNALMKMPVGLFPFKGKVQVMFTINSEGKTTDIYLKKSAQFSLDEGAINAANV